MGTAFLNWKLGCADYQNETVWRDPQAPTYPPRRVAPTRPFDSVLDRCAQRRDFSKPTPYIVSTTVCGHLDHVRRDTGSFVLPIFPAVGPADHRSFIETKLDFFQQHFSLVAYTRPREVQGAAAVDLLLRVLGAGLTLRGGKDRMGFVFLYELLTGTRGAAWHSMVGCRGWDRWLAVGACLARTPRGERGIVNPPNLGRDVWVPTTTPPPNESPGVTAGSSVRTPDPGDRGSHGPPGSAGPRGHAPAAGAPLRLAAQLRVPPHPPPPPEGGHRARPRGRP